MKWMWLLDLMEKETLRSQLAQEDSLSWTKSSDCLTDTAGASFHSELSPLSLCSGRAVDSCAYPIHCRASIQCILAIYRVLMACSWKRIIKSSLLQNRHSILCFPSYMMELSGRMLQSALLLSQLVVFQSEIAFTSHMTSVPTDFFGHP